MPAAITSPLPPSLTSPGRFLFSRMLLPPSLSVASSEPVHSSAAPFFSDLAVYAVNGVVLIRPYVQNKNAGVAEFRQPTKQSAS